MTFAHAEVKKAAKTPEKRGNAVAQPKKSSIPQPSKSPFNHVLILQKTIGNQAVQRLIKSGHIQTKLKISQPSDTCEQEAERIADLCMRSVFTPSLQYFAICGANRPTNVKCENLSKIATRQTSRIMTRTFTPDSFLQNLGASIQLSPSTRSFMESYFGYDFSNIRLHTDSRAVESARAINARAFTVGNDIIFGEGQYTPNTVGGLQLLSHELAHVIQQVRGGTASGPTLIYPQHYSDTDPCKKPPSHVTTMDHYIALVERAEKAYPDTSTINMITRIRKTKYSGFLFGRFISAPSSQGPLVPRDPLTDADVQAFACDIKVSMPGGGSTDPSHIFVALDVRRYPGSTILAPGGISAEAATTWAGDVGSAYGQYIAQESPQLEARSDQETRMNYWNEFSPYHDLMADIDGLAMSAKDPSAQRTFDPSQPLSINLRKFFYPAKGTGKEKRFTRFASVAGINWTGKGSKLTITPSSRSNIIERQIDLFVKGYLSTLIYPTIRSKDPFYLIEYLRREDRKAWFIDRFVKFIQDGLRGENP